MNHLSFFKNKEMDFEKLFKNNKIIKEYTKFTAKKIYFMIVFILLILLISTLAITLGPLQLSLKEVYSTILSKIMPDIFSAPNELGKTVIWNVRLPRLLMGLITGFGLSIAGAVMQPVLRNPLASPFTLGISSGAGFGAALAIICGKSIVGGTYFVVGNAFFFALLTSAVILGISQFKWATPEMMILTGVALSHLFSAATTLLQYFAEDWATSEVVFWLVGSLSKSTWHNISLIFPVVLCTVPLLMIKGWDLNAMSIGDEAAKSLGINVKYTRLLLIIFASFLTASTACFTGTIGFIGLIAPHITRMIVGGDNRYVIPISGFVGAFLLVTADIVAMNIMKPVILPIGVVTSFMGVPMFVFLIMKRKGRSC